MYLKRFLHWAAVGTVPLLASGWAAAEWPAVDAPNFVAVTSSLATSGQPSPAALADLKRLGVEAVISLGPRSGPDLVPEERAIVRAQGVEFISLPFPPDARVKPSMLRWHRRFVAFKGGARWFTAR